MSSYLTGWLDGLCCKLVCYWASARPACIFATKSGKCLKRKRKWPTLNMLGSPEEQPDPDTNQLDSHPILSDSVLVGESPCDGKHPALALEYRLTIRPVCRGRRLAARSRAGQPKLAA